MPDTKQQTLPNPVVGWTTIDEAAKIVERDHSTVRHWANGGKISCYRVGNTTIRLVNIDEVKAYSRKAIRIKRTKRPSFFES
jgi:excisionase family DNA binding protein